MRKPIIVETLKRIATQIGASLLLEPEYEFAGMITFASGRRSYFYNNKFNLNPIGSIRIAQDKGYARFYLQHHGYTVPDELTFYDESFSQRLAHPRTVSDAITFAERLGFPVILKPNGLSQGALVTKVKDPAALRSVAARILSANRVAIVQRLYTGRDYRAVVLDNEVISAYERIPLHVVGDGRSTVLQLARRKELSFVETGRDTRLNYDDFRIPLKLDEQGLNWSAVPHQGRVVPLLDIANLSTGGKTVDVTAQMHDDYRRLCVAITRDMDLRFCGVDLICADLTRPLSNYVVLEVNSSPGLDNYQYEDPILQQEFVDILYRKVVLALDRTMAG